MIFGQPEALRPYIEKHPQLAAISEIVDAPEVVAADAKPSAVIRSGRKTSMWMAIEAVREGRADAVVSAGNTGCLMGISKLLISMIAGIKRPAISTIFPAANNGSVVMLDLGANAECDETNLFQFAILGSAYAHSIGVGRPRVGILNIGSEAGKGLPYLTLAEGLLEKAKGKLGFDYSGFVEGDDIFKGKVDVIVTDGFSGNIALKTLEGTAKFMAAGIKDAIKSSILAKLGAVLMMGALRKFKDKFNPNKYNGAVLLGLSGIVVKSHGGADAYGFSQAVKYASAMTSSGFTARVREEMARLEE